MGSFYGKALILFSPEHVKEEKQQIFGGLQEFLCCTAAFPV